MKEWSSTTLLFIVPKSLILGSHSSQLGAAFGPHEILSILNLASVWVASANLAQVPSEIVIECKEYKFDVVVKELIKKKTHL